MNDFFSIKDIAQITSPFRSKLILKAYKPWIKKGEKVLDIGCGTGITTKMVMESFQVNVKGCDVKNYLITKIPFYFIPRKGKLPFPNLSFDVAMINDVLHHVEKSYHKDILKEALRVAKQVLIFEAEPTIPGKIFDMILNKLHYQSLQTPLTFRASNEWRELFKEMGLDSKFQSVESPFWYPFKHMAIMIKKKGEQNKSME